MKYPAYSRYKDSGVKWLGDVPEHWSTGKVGYAARILTGGTPDRNNDEFWENGTINWMTSGEVNMGFIREVKAKITNKAVANSNARLLPGNSVMIALNGQGKTKGMVAVLGIESTCNQSLAAIICDPHKLHYRYLYFYLRSRYKDIRGLVGDDAREGINLDHVKNIPVYLPSVEEQTSIATYLDGRIDGIDTLIAKQERLIELLREKRQSIILHAVTKGLKPDAPIKDSGVKWLGKIPAHWGLRRLKHLIEFITSGSRGWAEHYSDSGDIFIRIGNLTRESIEVDLADIQYVSVPSGAEGERTRISAGDLLISITAYLGSVAVAPTEVEGGYVSQHVALARPAKKNAAPRFLGYSILSIACKTQLELSGYGGTKIQLGLDDVKELSLLLPPLDEQVAIAEYIDCKTSKIDALIGKARRAIELLKEHRTGLISASVTGKIDVRQLAGL